MKKEKKKDIEDIMIEKKCRIVNMNIMCVNNGWILCVVQMYFIYMTHKLVIESEMIIRYMLSEECVVCSGFKVQTVTEGGWIQKAMYNLLVQKRGRQRLDGEGA